MKITRFAQSCLLIEVNNKRILIDPGYIQYKESYIENEWSDIDIILITHKHEDHCCVNAIEQILKNSKTRLYSSQEVANAYPKIHVRVVKQGDVLSFNSIKIEVVKAVHGWIPDFKDKKAINENIGFIVDDNINRLYHTSDTICFNNNYKCDIIFLPAVNHGIVMGPWEAASFAKNTKAKIAIPFHYDHPKHPADFELIKKEFKEQGVNCKFLNIEQSIKV